MIKYFEDHNDTFWVALLYVVCLLLVACLSVAISDNHDIRHYYVQHFDGNPKGTYCVVGQREWVSDVVSVCYYDQQQAVDTLLKLRGSK